MQRRPLIAALVGCTGGCPLLRKFGMNTGRRKFLLTMQFDYYGKLAAQLPLRRLRVIYAASGTIPAACVLRQSMAVIEHAIYWAEVSERE